MISNVSPLAPSPTVPENLIDRLPLVAWKQCEEEDPAAASDSKEEGGLSIDDGILCEPREEDSICMVHLQETCAFTMYLGVVHYNPVNETSHPCPSKTEIKGTVSA